MTPDKTEKALKKAHLHYSSDEGVGITRKKAGKKFVYVDAKGRKLKGANEKRIHALAIPPAYQKVWINPDPRGHIQAVARDARGRKQYRYHPDWVAFRDENKYSRMREFAKALPKIRQTTTRHLALKGLPREKVLAAVVQLLEKTLIRVGNDEYAKDNQSYGLTTLHDEHAKVVGAKVRFEFKGKSGIRHSISIEDPRLARIVKQCQDLPGHEIFQYVDDAGKRHDVKSDHVNEYLQQVSGEAFTAKDFRTWAGTILAAEALQEYKSFTSQTEAKKQVLTAIESVAKRLGNTKAICRKCYIHPAILEAHMDGSLAKTFEAKASDLLKTGLKNMRRDEAAILVLLEKRLKGANKK